MALTSRILAYAALIAALTFAFVVTSQGQDFALAKLASAPSPVQPA